MEDLGMPDHAAANALVVGVTRIRSEISRLRNGAVVVEFLEPCRGLEQGQLSRHETLRHVKFCLLETSKRDSFSEQIGASPLLSADLLLQLDQFHHDRKPG